MSRKKKVKPLVENREIELYREVWLRSPYGGHLIGPYVVLGIDPILLSRHYYAIGSGGNKFSHWMTFFNVDPNRIVIVDDGDFSYKGVQGTSKEWFCTEYVQAMLKDRTLWHLQTPVVSCPIKKQSPTDSAE